MTGAADPAITVAGARKVVRRDARLEGAGRARVAVLLERSDLADAA
jgi:hypothetical protein